MPASDGCTSGIFLPLAICSRPRLSSIGDGVIATDAEGRVTFMNPVAERLSGWTEEAAQGHSIEEILTLVREDTGERIENPVTHALRANEIVGLENHTILISKDGNRITVDDSACSCSGRQWSSCRWRPGF